MGMNGREHGWVRCMHQIAKGHFHGQNLIRDLSPEFQFKTERSYPDHHLFLAIWEPFWSRVQLDLISSTETIVSTSPVLFSIRRGFWGTASLGFLLANKTEPNGMARLPSLSARIFTSLISLAQFPKANSMVGQRGKVEEWKRPKAKKEGTEYREKR